MTRIELRQMERWPHPLRPDWERRTAPFGGSYPATLDKLTYELEHLGAELAVIQLTGRRVEIRRDGWPKANSLIDPPVLVTFDSDHGDLAYGCDQYDHWHGNLHAIALTLDRLRAVDRYGCVTGGEQYRGWSALPATSTPSSSVAFVADLLGVTVDVLYAKPTEMIRLAYKRTHPDTGGDAASFHIVREAAEALAVTSNGVA